MNMKFIKTLLGGVIIIALIFYVIGLPGHGKVISRSNEAGKITQLTKIEGRYSYRIGGKWPDSWYGTAALNSGKRVLLILGSHLPLPKEGDEVPLNVETYEDGTKFYMFDAEKWQMESFAF